MIEDGEKVHGENPNEQETMHEMKYNEQRESVKALLLAAQHEAAEWKLDSVQLWDPPPLAQRMITELDIDHSVLERKDDSIASGLWFDKDGEISDAPLWLNNEHYAWC